MIKITDAITESDILDIYGKVKLDKAGAVIVFVGTVRDETNAKQVVSIEYECYKEMAESQLLKIEDSAKSKWNLSAVWIVHRYGMLSIGDISVVIAVSSPHRNAAYEASRYVIDEIKKYVPIWKHELFTDGTVEFGKSEYPAEAK